MPALRQTSFDVRALQVAIDNADLCPLRIAMDALPLLPGEEFNLTDIEDLSGGEDVSRVFSPSTPTTRSPSKPSISSKRTTSTQHGFKTTTSTSLGPQPSVSSLSGELSDLTDLDSSDNDYVAPSRSEKAVAPKTLLRKKGRRPAKPPKSSTSTTTTSNPSTSTSFSPSVPPVPTEKKKPKRKCKSQALKESRPTKPIPRRLPTVQVQLAPTTSQVLPPPRLPLPPPPTFAIPPTSSPSEGPPPAKKVKVRSAEARARRRAANREKRNFQAQSRGLKDIWLKHLAKTQVYILENFDLETVPTGPGGWRGSPRRVYHMPRTIEEAVAEGFTEFEWDGVKSLVFLDCKRRLVMFFKKADLSPEGIARQGRMTETIRKASEGALLKGHWGKGDFHALRDGVLHSGGTPEPLCASLNATNRRALDSIFTDPDFLFEARRTDITFRMYNPNMHSTYWDIREAISAQYPDYPWNFDALPFGLTTVNFGPQTVCDDHIDDTDNAFGLAPTRSFGPFDYKKGGHIVFPTLMLAVQFPQGTEGWIPTAILPHANTRIADDETRYSVTSYNSGGMSEWVYRGGLSKRGWLKYLKDHSRAMEEAGLDMERPGILRERLFPTWT